MRVPSRLGDPGGGALPTFRDASTKVELFGFLSFFFGVARGRCVDDAVGKMLLLTQRLGRE